MTYQTFNNTLGDYDQALVNYGAATIPSTGGWGDGNGSPVDPTPSVAQGFLINNPAGQINWGRTFSVNN